MLAIDPDDGTIRWHHQFTPNDVWDFGGRQYVAVASGWGGWMKGSAPELYGQGRGSALFVFALPSAAR